MPQTRRTAQYLITNAYYLIGVLSPDEIPTSTLITRGLDRLNDLLDYFAVNGPCIPYTGKIEFNLVEGQDEYSISNILNNADIDHERIVDLEFVNVSRSSLSYPVRVISRADLYNVIRLQNLQTRPTSCLLIRENLQSVLKFYPVPDFEYGCTVQAKFMFDKLDLSQQINEIPVFMQRYLIYELAKELANYYPSSTFTDDARAELKKMQGALKASADIDISIMADNTLMTKYRNGAGAYFGSFWIAP